MKLLIISHAYSAPENRKKATLISEKVETFLIFPRNWRTKHGEELENKESVSRNLSLFPIDTYGSGDGGRYVYCPIPLLLKILKAKPDVLLLEEEPFSFVSFEIVVIERLLKLLRLLNRKATLCFFTWENLVFPLGFIRSFVERTVFLASDKGICGNKEAEMRIRKRRFLGDTLVLPQFGVDLDLFKKIVAIEKNELKEKLNIKKKVVGYVGRFVPEKGIKTLIKAISLLPKDYILLLVSTSKSLPEEYQKFADDLNISDRVRIASGIPHKDLYRYYGIMDVLVLPSETTETWKEQFGRVLIEAMACGTPVVGSSSGAIPEVISEAGLIFSEGDAVDLSEKIKEANRNSAEFSRAGVRRVNEKYSLSEVVTRLLDFLTS